MRKIFKILKLKLVYGLLSVALIFSISALYDSNKLKFINIEKSDKNSTSNTDLKYDNPAGLINVGFSSRIHEPDDQEVKNMVDEVIKQILGEKGLAGIIKRGDRVIIKVNNVSPHLGKTGEKGRGIITDPRIVRYVAEKVRDIIGFDGAANLKVVDAVFSQDTNPSSKENKMSFHYARLERTGNNSIDPEDNCYDYNADGILDGTSKAELVNLDAIDFSDRYITEVKLSKLNKINICMPKFLRTKKEAGESDEYCDVLIGLPVFKSHGLEGITGAIKLHYGFRLMSTGSYETGRFSHSGLFWDSSGIHKKQNLTDYLCAQHIVRDYDLVIMDCLTGNRRGPLTPNSSVYSSNESEPVDYILTNALLCSIDSVAIDTVEALFAGYKKESIPVLETAMIYNIGIDEPGLINLIGFNAFSSHRKFIYESYHSKELYPFQDNWGEARIMYDYDEPANVSLSGPVKTEKNFYIFKYTAVESKLTDMGLVRVDFLVNGKLFACRNKAINNKGEFQLDLSGIDTKKIICQIAAWDMAFNCALSNEIIIY